MKNCSKERGCAIKTNLGGHYQSFAERLAYEHSKRYGVYRCPHCGGTHLTTRLDKKDEYPELLYITKSPVE